jgi:hypothetical protein
MINNKYNKQTKREREGEREKEREREREKEKKIGYAWNELRKRMELIVI